MRNYKFNPFIRRTVITGFILFGLISTISSQLQLNAHDLTINNKLLIGLNTDKLTDLLGRPTAIKKNELLAEILGPEIYYHSKGLKFHFNAKSKDPEQKVWMIQIYFVKSWDKDHLEFFLPYSGKFTPEVNANMKVKDLLLLLEEFKPSLETAEERRKEAKEAIKIVDVSSSIQHDIVAIENEKAKINFHCEELTKFLEFMTIHLKN